MRKSEIGHGDSFSCRIQGIAVTGVVNTLGIHEGIALCNNKKHNATCTDMMGKKYAWYVRACRGVLDFDSYNVTMFRITKRAVQPAAKAAVSKYKQTVRTAAKIVANETPAQKVRRLEAELIAEKKRLQEEEEKKVPDRFMGWKVIKDKQRLIFGCGDVQLSPAEIENWLKVQEVINLRLFGGDISAYEVAIIKVRMDEAIKFAERVRKVQKTK